MDYARAEGPSAPGVPDLMDFIVHVLTLTTPKANTARRTQKT